LTIADGKTLTASNTLTFTGTDTSSVAFGTGGTVVYTSNKLSVHASTTSAELAGVISDETGSGELVFGTSPTFTTTIDGGATFGAFASSTALTVGYTGTAASTTNISNGMNASGVTKIVNIGTGGAAGSTSNVNIGSPNGGTTTVNSNLSVAGNAVVTGNLTVNGTTTTFNTNVMSVDDKNIDLGSVAIVSVTGTITAGSAVVTSLASTANIIPGSTVTSLTSAGTVTLPASTTVLSIDSATQITLSQALTGTGSAAAAILNISGATDATANGGGITLKGATDKTITWDSSNTNWTSSEHWNIASGKSFKINNVSVLDATTLGLAVVSSSLTSVGTIGTGVWQGTIVNSTYGGTGVNNGGRTLTISTGNLTLTAQSGGSSVTVPSTGTLATLAGTETFTNKSLSDSTTYFIDEVDATKRMQFQLSSIGASTTRTLTVPNVNGTIVTTGDTGSVTDTMLAGSISNSKLTNNSITINGSVVNLGGSVTVSAIATAALTIGTGLSGSSYNGSSAVTIAIDSSVVTLTGTQTLTNKTLTTPVISSISNTGTLTLPTSTDTLVGKATTDVFTNKTFDTAGTGNVFKINGTQVSAITGTGSAVLATSPTISDPIISGTGTIAAGSITIDSLLLEDTATLSATTTGANQVIAQLAIATYRSVEFLVSITYSTSYHLTKILAIHDGTTVYMTQYGEIFSSASLATFDIDISGGNLRLLASPVAASAGTPTVFKVATRAIAV